MRIECIQPDYFGALGQYRALTELNFLPQARSQSIATICAVYRFFPLVYNFIARYHVIARAKKCMFCMHRFETLIGIGSKILSKRIFLGKVGPYGYSAEKKSTRRMRSHISIEARPKRSGVEISSHEDTDKSGTQRSPKVLGRGPNMVESPLGANQAK